MAKTDVDIPDHDNKARITLGLLNMVDDNSSASQRSMASGLGIALGLANAYLKRCVKKGLIKVAQAPANRYAYYLTPKGFSEKSRLTAEFLTQSFNLFRHVRTEGAELLGRCQAQGWNRVALYGLSDLSEIMTLSVRDYDVELVCIIDRDAEVAEFAGLAVFRDMPATQDVDAKIICDIARPQAAYDDACAGFPPDRVLAPGVLHISKNAGNGRRKRGARR
jgi:DNA-binding MarR family transcriptional regulator